MKLARLAKYVCRGILFWAASASAHEIVNLELKQIQKFFQIESQNLAIDAQANEVVAARLGRITKTMSGAYQVKSVGAVIVFPAMTVTNDLQIVGYSASPDKPVRDFKYELVGKNGKVNLNAPDIFLAPSQIPQEIYKNMRLTQEGINDRALLKNKKLAESLVSFDRYWPPISNPIDSLQYKTMFDCTPTFETLGLVEKDEISLRWHYLYLIKTASDNGWGCSKGIPVLAQMSPLGTRSVMYAGSQHALILGLNGAVVVIDLRDGSVVRANRKVWIAKDAIWRTQRDRAIATDSDGVKLNQLNCAKGEKKIEDDLRVDSRRTNCELKYLLHVYQ